MRVGWLCIAVCACATRPSPALRVEAVPGPELSFERNEGQFDPRARFVARTSAGTTAIGVDGISLPGGLALRLVGGAAPASCDGEGELPGRTNYYLGEDPLRWHAQVRHFRRVRVRAVYPGVDLLLHGHEGRLELDFELAPGADPDAVRLSVAGAESALPTADGALAIAGPRGALTLRPPVVYQPRSGSRAEVGARYVVGQGGEIRFALHPYDRSSPLVIDPVIVSESFLGGSGNEQGWGVKVAPNGNIWLVGVTYSPDFPLRTPLSSAINLGQPTLDAGAGDAYVVQLDPSATTLVSATYLGGSQGDLGYDVAVDASGAAYVAGQTLSSDFPTTAGAFQASAAAISHAFVTKLDAAGALVYSTYLAGSAFDFATGVAVDGNGFVYVTGTTASSDFPSKTPIYAYAGGKDAFVTKLTPTFASLVYSTWIGGGGDEQGWRIVLDGQQRAVVTGFTDSSDFPKTQSFGPLGAGDAFTLRVNAAGSALDYSTLVGGSQEDSSAAIVLDSAGDAFVAGETYSADFPAVGAVPHLDAGEDAFLYELDPSGALVRGIPFGGTGNDFGRSIAQDSSGRVFVLGGTFSADFPLRNDLGVAFNGVEDFFVVQFDPSFCGLGYSTYLGSGTGVYGDYGTMLTLDDAGDAWVFAGTRGGPFAAGGAPTARIGPLGKDDAFLVKLSGTSSASCSADGGMVTDAGSDGGTTSAGSRANLGCGCGSAGAAWLLLCLAPLAAIRTTRRRA